MTTISVYNRATTPLGLDLVKLTAAMQAYVDGPLAASWGVSARLNVTDGPVSGTWGMVFLDNADVEGALAYHTDDGLPLSKVFVKTVLDANESLSVSATHELAEMLVDPGCNSFSMKPDGTLFTLEVADAVEEVSFMIAGFAMSDFCLPAWFGQPGSGYDHCGALTLPFSLSHGGYCTTIAAGKMQQVFGSSDKQLRYYTEDRRGRRGAWRLEQIAATGDRR
jgi:hypothetical protein